MVGVMVVVGWCFGIFVYSRWVWYCPFEVVTIGVMAKVKVTQVIVVEILMVFVIVVVLAVVVVKMVVVVWVIIIVVVLQ